ncbi:MAG TPA: matrixin family metalloprotease [Acidimicrobiales bacterium]|nr:matrixin family metalloprotease [Acidimicrobiales bacterium]
MTALPRRRWAVLGGALAVMVALIATTCSSGSGDRLVTHGKTAATPVPTSLPPFTQAHSDDPIAAADSLHDLHRPAGALPSTAASPRTKDAARSRSEPVAGSTSTSSPPTATAGGCPDPKTCRRYQFVLYNGEPGRWPTGPDGRVTIRYYVNHNGSGLSADVVKRAIEAAFATWERAAPTVDFVYAGSTIRAPALGDGYSDIAFVNAGPGNAFAQVRDGVTTEADMFLSTGEWTWHPCEQRDNSCTRTTSPGSTGEGYRDELQSIVTHEGGHWLGLADMRDDQGLDQHLTMRPSGMPGDRFWTTLALGDVLGVRALYPCSCPLPPIYSP